MPSIDVAQLAALLTARLTVLDVSDTDLAVVVSYVDTETGKATPIGTYPLGTMEQVSEPVPSGRYQFEFRLPAASKTGPRCTIDIADGKSVFFVAAASNAIAVTVTGATPKTAADLLVTGSRFCKA